MFDPIPAPAAEDWSRVHAPVEQGEPLVDLAEAAPEIAYAAAYAKAGYPGAFTVCYTRETVARMLKKAAAALPEGYSLLVYDALRPLTVQRGLYEECMARMKAAHPAATPGELAVLVDDFVAYPRADALRPSPHTTGGAVDLTLCRHGIPLDMGTGFDDNTPKAWADALERSGEDPEARDNRRLLYHVMTGAGFVSYPCEWWHFAYGERLWALRTGNTPIYGYRKECGE